VLGSVLVIIISMASSFTVAMICGALFYSVAALVCPALWSVTVERKLPANTMPMPALE
jgi:hypothetical protein